MNQETYFSDSSRYGSSDSTFLEYFFPPLSRTKLDEVRMWEAFRLVFMSEWTESDRAEYAPGPIGIPREIGLLSSTCIGSRN